MSQHVPAAFLPGATTSFSCYNNLRYSVQIWELQTLLPPLPILLVLDGQSDNLDTMFPRQCLPPPKPPMIIRLLRPIRCPTLFHLKQHTCRISKRCRFQLAEGKPASRSSSGCLTHLLTRGRVCGLFRTMMSVEMLPDPKVEMSSVGKRGVVWRR